MRSPAPQLRRPDEWQELDSSPPAWFQGLIAHGEHLTSRCLGWTDALVRQNGWAPEAA